MQYRNYFGPVFSLPHAAILAGWSRIFRSWTMVPDKDHQGHYGIGEKQIQHLWWQIQNRPAVRPARRLYFFGHDPLNGLVLNSPHWPFTFIPWPAACRCFLINFEAVVKWFFDSFYWIFNMRPLYPPFALITGSSHVLTCIMRIAFVFSSVGSSLYGPVTWYGITINRGTLFMGPLLGWKIPIVIKLRRLKNVQFFSSSRKTMILTTGIPGVFRGLKSESDTEIGQKGTFFKGLRLWKRNII